MELVRSVFHPDCVVVGTLEEGSLGDYPIDSLVLALRYKDEVVRIHDD